MIDIYLKKQWDNKGERFHRRDACFCLERIYWSLTRLSGKQQRFQAAAAAVWGRHERTRHVWDIASSQECTECRSTGEDGRDHQDSYHEWLRVIIRKSNVTRYWTLLVFSLKLSKTPKSRATAAKRSNKCLIRSCWVWSRLSPLCPTPPSGLYKNSVCWRGDC